MNVKQTREAAMVMLAFTEGKIIQVRCRQSHGESQSQWFIEGNPNWDWLAREYRVAPEAAEGWINIYPDATYGFWQTKEEAQHWAAVNARTIKVRQIIE